MGTHMLRPLHCTPGRMRQLMHTQRSWCPASACRNLLRRKRPPRWSHLSTLAILLGTSGQPGWGVVNPYLHKKTVGDKTLLTSSLGCTDADLLLRVHRDNCEGFQRHDEQHEPPPRIHGASVKPWYAQHVQPSLHLDPLAAKARAGQR